MLFGGLTLIVSACCFYKVRKVHIATFDIVDKIINIQRETGALYDQIVAYQELNKILSFRRPLPPLRGWAASPDFLLVVAQHAIKYQPNNIVECSSGSSTITLARCCEINGIGHVYSLEHDSEYAEATRVQLKEQGLENWATVIDAPLVAYNELNGQYWYSLEQLAIQGPIDLLVVDGPPRDTALLARYPSLPMLSNRMSPKTTIFLDDADREEETATLKRWESENSAIKYKKIHCEKGCACVYFQ